MSIKRLLADLKQWSELDRETDGLEEVTQGMCDRYIKITEFALDVLKEHNTDKYDWYDLNGTVGNEIELFVEAIECLLEKEDK